MSQLQLLDLELTDFRSFTGTHHFELEREPGLYYVTGKNLIEPDLGANGSGKSSLWDAIMWILWNKTIRDTRPADAIIPWGMKKPKTCGSLRFKRNGKAMELIRTRKPNSLVLIDREGKREIEDKEVPSIIGMSEDVCRRTLILGQFGTLFLDMQPEQQTRMFSEALSLDVWLDRIARAGDRADAAAKAAQAAEGRALGSEGALAEARQQAAQALTDGETWDEARSARLRQAEDDITTIKREVEDSLAKAPPKPKGRQAEQEGIEQAERQNNARRDQLRELSGALRRADSALAIAEQQGGALDRQFKELEAAANAKEANCPECGQPAPKSHFKDKMRENQNQKNANVTLVADARVVAKKAKEVFDALEDKIRSEEESITLRRERLAEGSAGYNAWERTHSALERRLQDAEDKADNIDAEVNPHKAARERALDRVETLEESYRAAKAEQSEAEATAEQVRFWIKAFKEIRLELIDAALHELEVSANSYAEQLGLVGWAIRFDTEKETKGGKITFGLSVRLFPPDFDQPVKWESYSGGESQRWQLAVAFGLSEILLARAGITPNIEVLDEPTQHMSDLGIEHLVEYLRERAITQGKAIYLVDHQSLESGAFRQVITIEKDAKGSRVA